MLKTVLKIAIDVKAFWRHYRDVDKKKEKNSIWIRENPQ